MYTCTCNGVFFGFFEGDRGSGCAMNDKMPVHGAPTQPAASHFKANPTVASCE